MQRCNLILLSLCFLILESGCFEPQLASNSSTSIRLVYSQVVASYKRGVAIPNNIPSASTGVFSLFTINPILPTGLLLDPSTGVISGTPLVSGHKTYTVTATNYTGAATAVLDITVSDSTCSILGSTRTNPSSDEGYRVVILPPNEGETNFPRLDTSWQVKYSYVVPPTPCASSWNYTNQTFYIWGDIDFDEYGNLGSFPISDYTYNQIAPQLSIGNSLTGNDSFFKPSWKAYSTWIVQAQYYWMRKDGTSFALNGSPVSVNVGDTIVTLISYDADGGGIKATITAPGGTSSILIPRPFLNETPAPFGDWKSFFQSAVNKSSGLIIRPSVNIESHYVDQQTLCSILPFQMTSITLPTLSSSSENYSISQIGSFSCPVLLAKLKF